MTDWRALTQGGCIAGSFDVSDHNGILWTCPASVYRFFCQYDHYFKVTPGVTYKFGGASAMWGGVYRSGVGDSNYVQWGMSGRGNVIYWSNEINTHAPTIDFDQYWWYDSELNCDCNCNDGGGGSCFIAGTKVLCYDSVSNITFYKNIEDLVPNDKVLGAKGEINIVLGLYTTKLGNQRSLMKFEDGSLYFSDEHPFWVKYKDFEGFGVHNYTSYYREKVVKDMNGFTLLDHEIAEALQKPLKKLEGYDKDPIIIYNDIDYATLLGYKHNKAIIDRSFDSSTKLYSPVLSGSHTLYVNDYLVGSFMLNDYDYSKIHM